ncbi:hypothetical protein IKF30_02625 [Candidatus Saccharibacteria bacterium]|nr:hypothetical protein [Candidatus Saccharibacteria bacterium]
MSKESRNICGPVDRTPGQNLATAIRNTWQDIGFPPYNYDKVLAILNQALTTEEVDIICRGFGFNHVRQRQSEIAKDLNMEERSISPILAKAVDKLQAASYRKQFYKLMITPDELFARISELEQDAKCARELKETKHRLQAAEKSNAELTAMLKKLTNEKAALVEDNKRLTSKTDYLAERVAKSNGKIAQLIDLVSYHKDREKLVKDHFDISLERISKKVNNVIAREVHRLITQERIESKKELVAKVATLDVEKTDGLRELDILEESRDRLHKIGINSVSMLVTMSRHNLRKMGVDAATLTDAEDGLSKIGLSFRAS